MFWIFVFLVSPLVLMGLFLRAARTAAVVLLALYVVASLHPFG